jgi:hypothetical protein
LQRLRNNAIGRWFGNSNEFIDLRQGGVTESTDLIAGRLANLTPHFPRQAGNFNLAVTIHW